MRIATVQARMGSSRLPGKVLMPVNGIPMILQQVFRLQKFELFDKIFVATTDAEADDVLCEVLAQRGVEFFRGSENDVLGRLVDGLSTYSGRCIHFEFSGDSPLADRDIVEFVYKNYQIFAEFGGKFVTNGKEITFPNGTEVCIYDLNTLRSVNSQAALDDPEREDVDKVFLKILDKPEVLNVKAPPRWHAPDIYIEVDEQSDLDLLRAVVKNFQNENTFSYFQITDVIKFLRTNKELKNINADVVRKYWNYKK